MINKNMFKYLVLFGSILMFAGCNSDGSSNSSKSNRTSSGYDFKVVKDVAGESPQLEDFAFFDLSVTSDDSLIQSSHQQKDPFMVKISDDRNIYGAFAPVIDMLRTMSPGDSCVLYFPRDSFANGGAGMEQFEMSFIMNLLLEK